MARKRYETSSEREEWKKEQKREKGKEVRDFESKSRGLDEDLERSMDGMMNEAIGNGISKVAEVVGFVGAAGACEQLAVTCQALAELETDERDALDEKKQAELARLNIRSSDLDKE